MTYRMANLGATDKELEEFRQFVLERYGKSIYQIELELAMAEYKLGNEAIHSWRRSELFIQEMLGRFLMKDKSRQWI